MLQIIAESGSCSAQFGQAFSAGPRRLSKRRPEECLLITVLRARKDLGKPPCFRLTIRAARRTSINATAVIESIFEPSAITSVLPYVNTRFVRYERFCTMASFIGADVEQHEGRNLTRTVYLGIASMSTIVPSARLSNRLDSYQVENNGCLSPVGPEPFDPEEDVRSPTAPS